MVKKAFLLLALAASTMSSKVALAQKCYTDEMHQQLKAQHPDIAISEAELKEFMDAQLSRMDLKKFKTTNVPFAFQDTATLYVPIVFHLIHDYGNEYVDDNEVYKVVKDINDVYNRANSSLVNAIVAPFKTTIPGTSITYAAKTNIRFVLPTKDPKGNPTHGITRERSYLAYAGNNQAKLNVWSPQNYINLWIIRKFGGGVNSNVAAYALQPAAASNIPWYDGVIGILQNGTDMNLDNTLGHELGHSLNLNHPWNTSQSDPGVNCGDDDVDDTPPTKGHNNCGTAALVDSVCATGYAKIYSGTQAYNLFGLDSTATVTINYPDTANTQNLMDYSYCSKMFTYLQGVRMRNALRSSVAGRSNLCSASNLEATGALLPRVDMAPIADFSVEYSMTLPPYDTNTNRNVFVCPNASNFVNFRNRSWNDTVTAVKWTFPATATTPTSTSTGTVSNKFTESGWVGVTIEATGNNTGTTTYTNPRAVYVADPNAINAKDYLQEFNPNDTAKFPIFNYFNNDHKWEFVDSFGAYDKTCIRFNNYDRRTSTATLVNTPMGDYDDFYTPAYDFSQMSGANPVYLNFFTAGAFRSNNPADMSDTLQISYSINCGTSWVTLKRLRRADIGNNGIQLLEFRPSGPWNWQPQSISLPTALKNSSKVYFRFRYKVGADANYFGTGNHFYLDRINFSNYTASVSNPNFNADGIAIAPNPTNNSSFIIIKDAKDNAANIIVSDVTGKVVYQTNASLTSGVNRIEIPAESIAVKGMYLVQIISGSNKHTEKLVVY